MEIDGFEGFDSLTECLEMLKEGFGLKDAPKLFTDRVHLTFKKHGLHEVRSCEKVYVKHVQGFLVLMISAHTNDFKATGKPEELTWFNFMMKEEFGDVSIERGTLEHDRTAPEEVCNHIEAN